ncbi:MAG: L-histidine N(alpha)-methyltransferase [Gammaproteobacteria bacterium]
MSSDPAASAKAKEIDPANIERVNEVIAGLSAPQKRISPKYLYDQKGSKLFDRLAGLPEYYLTRTELKILDTHLDEMATHIGPRASVIEFGSGSGTKIRLLLDRLSDPAAYVPVDISSRYLLAMAEELAIDYPHVTIRPVFADFTRPFDLPTFATPPDRNLVFFPGSTIGNFDDSEACALLKVMRVEAKPGGALLIGVDLQKDPDTIRAAYNDSQGLTAEFNLNVLRHLNRAFGANFELEHFRHEAIYDEANGRIEMRLISLRPQTVTLAETLIPFERNEYIVTEHSRKYSLEAFANIAREAGFEFEQAWLDENALFSVQYLTVPA